MIKLTTKQIIDDFSNKLGKWYERVLVKLMRELNPIKINRKL